jgi:rubrerythrin
VAAGLAPVLRPAPAAARTRVEAAELHRALELEQRAVAVYGAAAKSTTLDSRLARLAAQIRDQEQEHAEALGRALRQRGGAPPPPVDANSVPGLREAIAQGGRAFARLAAELEATLVRVYYEAEAHAVSPGLRSALASVMANEGQHLALVRLALDRDPTPRAFETGRLQ